MAEEASGEESSGARKKVKPALTAWPLTACGPVFMGTVAVAAALTRL